MKKCVTCKDKTELQNVVVTVGKIDWHDDLLIVTLVYSLLR